MSARTLSNASSNHTAHSAPTPSGSPNPPDQDAQQKSRPDSPACPVVLQSATSCYNSSADSEISRCANDAKPPLPQREGRGSSPSSTGNRQLTTWGCAPGNSSTPLPNRRDLQTLRSKLTPLSACQQNAIELLVTGKTDAAVAHDLKIHRVTVTRWRLYNHLFQAELNRRRQEVWGSAADKVRSLLRHAVRVYRKQVRSEDEYTAFRAAQSLLRMAGQSRFAPPDEPTDPHGVLDQHARKKRIEISSIDPRIDLLDDDDRALALSELLQKQAEEE